MTNHQLMSFYGLEDEAQDLVTFNEAVATLAANAYLLVDHFDDYRKAYDYSGWQEDVLLLLGRVCSSVEDTLLDSVPEIALKFATTYTRANYNDANESVVDSYIELYSNALEHLIDEVLQGFENLAVPYFNSMSPYTVESYDQSTGVVIFRLMGFDELKAIQKQ